MGGNMVRHQLQRSTVRSCAAWLLMAVVFAFAMLSCMMPAHSSFAADHTVILAEGSSSDNSSSDTSSSTSSSSSADITIPEAADRDSWSSIAADIATELAMMLEQYSSGDSTTAGYTLSAALNTNYVASNLASVITATIDSTTQQTIAQYFADIKTAIYQSADRQTMSDLIDTLNDALETATTTLDNTDDLTSPHDYAVALAQRTLQEREQLEAQKVNINTGRGDRTWTQVAQEMQQVLQDAVSIASSGDGKGGAQKVNEAYYQYYEKLGFEKNVMNAIGGSRVSLVESRFKELRKAMIRGDEISSIEDAADELAGFLLEDAQALDGGAGQSSNPFIQFITSSFGQAFIILIREGLEALLVVVAVIAYLVKSGHRKSVRWIWFGVLAGLLASFAVAGLFMVLFSGNGPVQEIMEGAVALIAMVMLLFSSNWMLSKSSVKAWDDYIKRKTRAAVDEAQSYDTLSMTSMLSLATLSFLAVFREGAETVLFYQSIYTMTQDSTGMWLGGLLGAVVIVALYFVIRYTSVKIALRPFFLVTSIVMAFLVIMFAGGGVHSLIEGDALPGMYLSSVPTNEWIGLYPYVETLTAQALAAAAVIGLFVYFGVKSAKERKQDTSQASSR